MPPRKTSRRQNAGPSKRKAQVTSSDAEQKRPRVETQVKVAKSSKSAKRSKSAQEAPTGKSPTSPLRSSLKPRGAKSPTSPERSVTFNPEVDFSDGQPFPKTPPPFGTLSRKIAIPRSRIQFRRSGIAGHQHAGGGGNGNNDTASSLPDYESSHVGPEQPPGQPSQPAKSAHPPRRPVINPNPMPASLAALAEQAATSNQEEAYRNDINRFHAARTALVKRPETIEEMKVAVKNLKTEIGRFARGTFSFDVDEERMANFSLSEMGKKYPFLMRYTNNIADASKYGWEKLFTDRFQRSYLAAALVGKVMETHILDHTFFGAEDDLLQHIHGQEADMLNHDAFDCVNVRTEVLREYELPGYQGRWGRAAATLSNAQQIADATHEHLLVPLLTLILGPNDEEITLEFNRRRDIIQAWVRRFMGSAAEINNAIRFANLNRGGRKPVLYVWRSIPKFAEFNADEHSCKNKREIDALEEDGERLIVSMSMFPALYAYESVKVPNGEADSEPSAVRRGERGKASRASNPANSKRAENHQRPPPAGDGSGLSTIVEESTSQVGDTANSAEVKGDGRTTSQSPRAGQTIIRPKGVKQMAKKTSKVILRQKSPLSNKENKTPPESNDDREFVEYIRERAAVRRTNLNASPKGPKAGIIFGSPDGGLPTVLNKGHSNYGHVAPRGEYFSGDKIEEDGIDIFGLEQDEEEEVDHDGDEDEVIDECIFQEQVVDGQKDDSDENYERGNGEEDNEEDGEAEGETDEDDGQPRSRRSSSPSPEPSPHTPPMQIRGGGGNFLRIRGGAGTHVPGTLDEEPTQSEYGPPSEVASLPTHAVRRSPRRTTPNDVYAGVKSYDSSASTRRLSNFDGRSERTGSTVQKPAPVVQGPLIAPGPSGHESATSSSPPVPPGPSGPPRNPDVPTDLVSSLLETMVSRAQVLLVWSPPPDVTRIVEGPINHNVYNATVPRTTRYLNAISRAKSKVLETFSRARVTKTYRNLRRSALPKDPVVHDPEAKFVHYGPLLHAISRDLQRRDLARASGDPRLYASLMRRYRRPYGWLRHHWEGVEETTKLYGALMALAVAYGWTHWYLETDVLAEFRQNPRVAGWKYLRQWATGLG